MVWERSGGDERANQLNIMVSILSLKGGRYVGFGGVAQKRYNAPTNVCTIKKNAATARLGVVGCW